MPVNPYNLDMITKICNHLNTACAIITYRHNFHFEYANDLYYQLLNTSVMTASTILFPILMIIKK